MSPRLALLVLPLCAFLAACSPRQDSGAAKGGSDGRQAATATNSSSVGKTASSRPVFKTLADVPGSLQQQGAAFAQKLERTMKEGKTLDARAAFDRHAIVEGVFEGVPAGNKKIESFKEGMERGMQRGIQQLSAAWEGQEPKFKHLCVYRGDLAARFRFASEQHGIALVDFVLRTNRVGEFVIANLCNYAMGFDMVEQSRRTIAPVLAELDRSFLETLVSKPGLTIKDMQRFGDLARCANSGDTAGATDAYKSLPPALKDSMSAAGLYIMALQRSDDSEAYKQALKDAAARFKSANFELMLVDVYALEKDFGKAADCVEKFMQFVERDSALLALKSLMLINKGDSTGAVAALKEAMELEPDCMFAHLKGLDVLLAAKDFKGVASSMSFLEKSGGYSFKGNMEDEVWSEFKKSPESAPWR